ncbi:MAG: ABC transporter substrate-binding protein [Chloroflexota bacterium]|nr:ABC transporter substrate-binding protein [Chloroflexota bacterium]MDE3193982.1 ABC transporter substrate-binding protein [Chloroflexota bacterium]
MGALVAACGASAPAAAPSASAAATQAAATAAATSSAPATPIRIGALTSLSGPFAPWGVKIKAGMEYAASELNAAGGVNGRKIEIVSRDDKNNPSEAVTDYKDLVESQNVVAVGGIVSSDVGLAVARAAEQSKVPLFTSLSGANEILTKASRYTFRTCLLAASMDMAPIAAFVKDKKITSVGAIIADYAWGHSIEAAIKKDVETLPGVKVQYATAPVTEKDFTPYLRKLQPANPQLLILTGHPPGNFPITKTALGLGIGQYMFGAWSPPETWVQQVGSSMYGHAIEGSCADWSSPQYQALAKKFYDSTKSFMDFNALDGYAIVNLVANAVSKGGSADPTKIADFVRSGSYTPTGYAYPLSYTQWGELKEATPVIYTFAAGDPPGGVFPGAGWHPEVLLHSPAIPPAEPAQ